MNQRTRQTVTREMDTEHLSIVERNRIRANVQATFGELKAAVKRVAAGIEVPLNVPMEPSAADILALERKLRDLKSAVGVA